MATILIEKNVMVAMRDGVRLALDVSSSNFPRFGRNSNSGGEVTTETVEQYRLAINRIFHDTARPSHLILPIIER